MHLRGIELRELGDHGIVGTSVANGLMAGDLPMLLHVLLQREFVLGGRLDFQAHLGRRVVG